MQRRTLTVLAVSVVCILIACSVYAQQPAPAAGGGGGRGGGAAAGAAGAQAGRGGGGGGGQARIPLFFKEEWTMGTNTAEHPASQESVVNPNLEIKMYGQSHGILITGAATNESNPVHLWTGECTTSCAVALRHKTSFADLTGLARMKWVSKMSGYHEIRPIVKLAPTAAAPNGVWLVGDHADNNNVDWITHEFSLSGMRWLTLDITRVVTTGTWVANPDLSKVDEIGFADLMPASGHGAGGWADVALFEVYGKTVPR